MKNLGFLIFTSILLVLSASTRAELATVTLPNLSLIKAATFIEVIRALGEENSKTFEASMPIRTKSNLNSRSG